MENDAAACDSVDQQAVRVNVALEEAREVAPKGMLLERFRERGAGL